MEVEREGREGGRGARREAGRREGGKEGEKKKDLSPPCSAPWECGAPCRLRGRGPRGEEGRPVEVGAPRSGSAPQRGGRRSTSQGCTGHDSSPEFRDALLCSVP